MRIAMLWIAAAGLWAAFVAQPQAPREVSALYAETCANCHGGQLQGASAASLVDGVWRFGGEDEALARSIRDGRVEDGMPAFGAALSEQEIRALVIFVRERTAAAQAARAKPARPAEKTVVRSQEHDFLVETVVEGVETPWSIAFLPDGRMLVTEKVGRLRVVENGRLLPPIGDLPAVSAQGQGGLLAVAVHPEHPKNGWIYLSYSDPGAEGTAMTAVVRGRLESGRLADQQTLFRAPAATYRRGGVHFGSRFVFDGRGHLFFSIGERGRPQDAQDLSRPNGKVHRIHDDGRVPADNPFLKAKDALPTIWSYGHRNPQGLARHPATGELWETEHGPRGGDELNVIAPGRNYGWPIITHGMNYDGTPITHLTARAGLEPPVTHWTPSIAVCAIDFYAGSRFPRWRNHLLVSSLAAEELRRLVLDGRKVGHQEVLFRGIGRIRDVVSGPDGHVYLALNGPDRIARLVPVPRSGPDSAQAPNPDRP